MGNSNPKKLPFLFAVTLIGTAALTSQILLVREIVNLFAGNELLYGLTIFLWLIMYSCGSGLLGKFSKYVKNRLNTFIILQSAIALLPPFEILLSRLIKNFLGIPLGATLNLTTTIFIILLLLAPVTLILGFQFALASTLLASILKKETSQISRVYIFESLGSVLGGIALTYLLLFFLNAFQIAAVLVILISGSLLIIGQVLTKRKVLILGSGLLIFAVILFASANYLNFQSTRLGWKDYQLVEVADSPYGRITILEDQGTLSFFENGELFFSEADQVGKEEVAHLSMLLHPRPQDVLLIGGGVSGITNELLKYQLKSLDYVELDYKMVELASKHIEFNPAVKIFTADGITYLKETDKKYSLIIINLPNPSTAQINRFYTLEFFRLCKEKLLESGILTFTLETSESFIGKELKLLNQSVHKTFSKVFKHVAIIPGSSNYYFGSDKWFTHYRWPLINRWRQRNIATQYFKSDNLYYILWPNKIKYVRDTIQFDESTPINTSLKPISYYLELLVWASYFYSPIKNFFYLLMKIKFLYFLIFLTTLLLAIKFISLKIKRITLPTIITLLGFTGMCVQLIIIYSFQSLYGYVYHVIGLLTAAFIGGLAAGSFGIHSLSPKIKNPQLILKIVLASLLFLVMAIFASIRFFPLPLASFLVALPIGSAFPLAVKIHEKYKREIGSLAGILYGSDLFGGALAGIVTTIFLIPIFGIMQTFMIAIVVGAASLAISYS